MTRACFLVLLMAVTVSPAWAMGPVNPRGRSVEAGVQGAGGAVRPGAPRGGAGVRGRRGALAEEVASGASAAEVEQLFDRFVRAQARVALQLTPSQMQTFGPSLTRLLTTRRRVQRERQRLLRELADVSRGAQSADEATVAARLSALDAQREQGEAAIREAAAALDQNLTVAQRARFRVFERRMEQQRQELLARARQAAEGRPPAAPPEP